MSWNKLGRDLIGHIIEIGGNDIPFTFWCCLNKKSLKVAQMKYPFTHMQIQQAVYSFRRNNPCVFLETLIRRFNASIMIPFFRNFYSNYASDGHMFDIVKTYLNLNVVSDHKMDLDGVIRAILYEKIYDQHDLL